MYSFEQIKIVHLEITSQCNARCPMCLRTVFGGAVNPRLPITELKLEQIKSIFDTKFLNQIHRLYMCGNYGDPLMGTQSLEAFEYFREQNSNLRLEMFTNGSARNAEWWKNLAKLKVAVRFGIDGLADTNHLYRRNTDFSKIIENAKTFIEAGGVAHWDYIVFRHNEHQVESAKKLSEQLGFESFRIKKTGRFFSNQKNSVKTEQEVHNAKGEIEYFLKQPLNPEYINPSLANESKLIATFGSFSNYLDKTKISCKVTDEKSIYVSAEGLVFPCCWTAIQLYPWYGKVEGNPVWNMINHLPEGKDTLSALKHGLAGAFKSYFIQRQIPESWDKESIALGKLAVCARICGAEFNQFKDQY